METRSWAERTQVNTVAGGPSEVVDCGAGWARLQLVSKEQLADPARRWLADPVDHICAQINQEEQRGSETDHTPQGSSEGK